LQAPSGSRLHRVLVCGVTLHYRSAMGQNPRSGGRRVHRHAGHGAAARTLDEHDLIDLVARAGSRTLLIVLDGVQDPHNLGAILRTADVGGVTAVVAPRDRAVPLTETVRRIACGAADRVPFVQVTNLARALDKLKEGGVWMVGTDDEAESVIWDTDLTGPLALVMGFEGSGLRRLTKEHCDRMIRIPMRGSVGSLNVSVATGICLFETLRQRSTKS